MFAYCYHLPHFQCSLKTDDFGDEVKTKAKTVLLLLLNKEEVINYLYVHVHFYFQIS